MSVLRLPRPKLAGAWGWLLAFTVLYDVIVTDDVKLAGIPLRTYGLAACLLVWAVSSCLWRRRDLITSFNALVLAVGVGIPVLWTVLAYVLHHQHDPAQPSGMSNAVAEASHFAYLLLYFPLADWFRREDSERRHLLWLVPTLLMCALTLVIWLVWVLFGVDYSSHQFGPLSGTIGSSPAGYRVEFVTQVMLVPAVSLTLARVEAEGLRRLHVAVLAVLLATGLVSDTRGYWLGMAAAAAVLVVLAVGWPTLTRSRGAAILLILVALLVSEVVLGVDSSGARTSQISVAQRFQEASQLLHGASRHLLLGSGLGATLPSGYVRSPTNPWSFELTYYQLLFELGLVGLLLTLALPITVIIRGWRDLRQRARWSATGSFSPPAPELRVALAATVGLLAADATNPDLINSVGMFALAVVCALVAPGLLESQENRRAKELKAAETTNLSSTPA